MFCHNYYVLNEVFLIMNVFYQVFLQSAPLCHTCMLGSHISLQEHFFLQVIKVLKEKVLIFIINMSFTYEEKYYPVFFFLCLFFSSFFLLLHFIFPIRISGSPFSAASIFPLRHPSIKYLPPDCLCVLV